MIDAEDESKSDDEEIHQLPDVENRRVAEQFLELFVLPELTSRLRDGVLAPQFIAQEPSVDSPGQLLCPTITLAIFEDGRPLKILFDEETRIELLLRLPSIKEMSIGSEIAVNEGEIFGYRIKDLPPNAGWALMINQSGRGRVAFDLRRNGRFARQHVKQARAFIRSAKLAAGSRNPRVAVENLFHAVEKACKAELLTLPLDLRASAQENALKRENHTRLRELYRSVGQEKQAISLYMTLSDLRNPANYYLKPFRIRASRLTKLIEDAESLEKAVRRRIPKASDARPEHRWM